MNHVEIVSPILTYDDVAKPKSKGGHFARVLDTVLPVNGAFVYWNNALTSNHVHMSCSSAPYEPHVLFKLCMAWLYFEPLFMACVAPWRRDNRYCQAMRRLAMPALLENPRAFRGCEDRGALIRVLTPLFPALPDAARAHEDPDRVLLYAVVMLFQGDILKRETRYAAFNMLNLRPGCIQTVEVRIKQGSSSSKENRMYMLLLANFVTGVINGPPVSWKHGANATAALLEECVATYIADPKVARHWRELHRIGSFASNSSMSGGTVPPKALAAAADSDVQVTSFGVVDYGRMRREIAKDSAFQQARAAMAAGVAPRMSTIPVSPMVAVKAGGDLENKTRRNSKRRR